MPQPNDPTKKVGKILSSLNPAQLKKGMELFSQMQKNGQAEELKKKFENVDKDKILEIFSKLDPEQIKQKVNNIDLNNIDIGEYMKQSDKLGLDKKK